MSNPRLSIPAPFLPLTDVTLSAVFNFSVHNHHHYQREGHLWALSPHSPRPHKHTTNTMGDGAAPSREREYRLRVDKASENVGLQYSEVRGGAIYIRGSEANSTAARAEVAPGYLVRINAVEVCDTSASFFTNQKSGMGGVQTHGGARIMS